MDRELDKNKIKVMNSIMRDPKLSKVFRDAMKAPLGSTKREYAKNTLSIMSKVGGIQPTGMGGVQSCGMGGPGTGARIEPFPEYTASYGTRNYPQYENDYSNMMIFPAAPKFKVTATGTGKAKMGQGGPNDPIIPMNFGSDTSPYQQNIAPQTNQLTGIGSTLGALGNWYGNTVGNFGYDTASALGTVNPFSSFAPGLIGSSPTGLATNIGATTDTSTPMAFMNNPAQAWSNLANTPMTPTPSSQTSSLPPAQTGNLTSSGSLKIPSSLQGSSGTQTGTTGTQTGTSGTQTGSTGTQTGTSGSTTGTTVDPFEAVFGASNPVGAYATDPAYITKISSTYKTIANLGVANDVNSLQTYINNNTNGKSPVTAQMIFDASNATGTPPILLASVFQLESNFGTAGAATTTMNPGNQGNTGTNTQTFPDWASGVMATATNLANRLKVAGTTSGTSGTSGTTGTTNTPDLSTPTGQQTAAAQAVADKTGAGAFATTVANSQFGGNLQSYIDTLDANLKTQYNLPVLESQLTTLKNEGGDLIPTLQQYISSKDQYLKQINQLIANTQDQMASMDMSSPFVQNQMNNYMNYLLTLQGRQNQRYGNFLNTAVTQYNTQVANLQDQYNTVYQQYQTTLTQKTAIAQNDYNTLFQSMTDLYNNLQQAPQLQANLTLTNQQIAANNLALTSGATGSNVKWMAEEKDYAPAMTDPVKDPISGITTKQPLKASNEIDLGTAYANAMSSTYSPLGVTDVINNGIKDGVANASTGTGGNGKTKMQTLMDYQKEVTTLANSQPITIGGNTYNVVQYAADIQPTINTLFGNTINSYVSGDVKSFKSATQDLLHGGGLQNESAWISKYSSKIDTEILKQMYNCATTLMAQGSTYSSNPDLLVIQNTQNTKAKKISDLSDSDFATGMAAFLTAVPLQ